MKRSIFLDGAFVPEDAARISIFDRGFLFGDGIYEVTAVIDGAMIDNDLHLARLQRSLGEISIPLPMPLPEIAAMQHELIARNGLHEGVIYLEVTRGAAERDFAFPADLKPTFVAFTQEKNLTDTKAIKDGIAVDLQPDRRWARRDIKTVMLLSQVLAKKQAREKGFQEAWLTEDGYVTEGASSTAFIIDRANRLITRPNSQAVLPGCTRQAILKIAAERQLTIEERLFSTDEAFNAAEAFLTSASSLLTPVIRIADRVIGDGKPGPLTTRLQSIYLELARQSATQARQTTNHA